MVESSADSPQTAAPQPMIAVRGLSKQYGLIRAIDRLDFTVNKGDVVGFLGPNGAGKTTTMRILCGSLGATAGHATVGGLDVFDHPQEVKRRIGYLPENPPLYKAMVVHDYLRFAGVLRGIDNPAQAADKVIAQVGLDKSVGGRPAAERIIGNLSKGFQQRVGLAQALIHNPDVLVLDEPTSGLDPAQRKEIRDLLLDLAQQAERTVILSTHVLGDVEAICSRVVIIDQGAVVVQDDICALTGEGAQLSLEVATPGPEATAALSQVSGVVKVAQEAAGHYRLTTSQDCRTEVARAAVPFGLLGLSQAQSLEDIYLRLTGAQQ